jgi:hypothetical protein
MTPTEDGPASETKGPLGQRPDAAKTVTNHSSASGLRFLVAENQVTRARIPGNETASLRRRLAALRQSHAKPNSPSSAQDGRDDQWIAATVKHCDNHERLFIGRVNN